ncbi:MAG TPA: hypothetical protein DIC53_02695, partial [Synergistaceae bacterium]|nr:hypothetical protein [Synergistaceae bacterium]
MLMTTLLSLFRQKIQTSKALPRTVPAAAKAHENILPCCAAQGPSSLHVLIDLARDYARRTSAAGPLSTLRSVCYNATKLHYREVIMLDVTLKKRRGDIVLDVAFT